MACLGGKSDKRDSFGVTVFVRQQACASINSAVFEPELLPLQLMMEGFRENGANGTEPTITLMMQRN